MGAAPAGMASAGTLVHRQCRYQARGAPRTGSADALREGGGARGGPCVPARRAAGWPAARGAALTRPAPRGPEPLLALDPLPAVVRLAAPTTLVMLIGAVSNVLYTYYVSRLGADAIAAVSLVFPISLVAITAMGGGIGAGAASVIARALGAGRRADAATAAEHALALAVAIGIAFGAVMIAGSGTVFRWMGGSGAVLEAAAPFARIVFGGATITFVGGMFDSICRGEGNVRVPAIWSSTSLLLQIALTPVFMFALGLGLPGAAIAMLGSQAIATIPRARHVLGGRGAVHPHAWPRRPSLEALREILRIGIPSSLSTTINYVGIMVLTGVVARLGTPDLAAYGLGTRLDFLLLSFAFGVSAAVLTLVGLATGAGRPERAASYVRSAAALIVSLLAVAAAILWWRPSLWIGLFSSDPGIHEVGSLYFRIIGPTYPFVGLSMVLAFAFQGLGRPTAPLAVMAIRVPVVLAAALACTRWLGLEERAVFATIAAGNVFSTAVLAALFVRLHRDPARASAHADAEAATAALRSSSGG
ncbi:MAG TPA: MATE family efflux transporter [Candidatus Binatia bacterium]|nr:MATE family efflux transporter [Candidatus Binatia bacterium]